ncbi:MAG: FAD-binding oxidoreductase [Casimicrobiaceae bacterium]|nr:FAD-binding oxidoreductase [Casimicrobiaceae bacterium]MDW8312394.1 FAD-binding oxidoreductase [Burkholderiales bacterium]
MKEADSPRILIIGAGVMGAASAYFLAARHGVRATLLERDLSFARASSARSASSIRQQFTTAVNIELSRRSWQFLAQAAEALAVDGIAPALALEERGYLYLATEAQRESLWQRYRFQREQGVAVRWLEARELAAQWPWLIVEDLAAGVWGEREEGWFDGPALHAAFLRKARSLGVRLERVTVNRLIADGRRVVAVETAEGERMAADAVLVAAGAWSGALVATLGDVLPIAPKKRDVFVLDSPARLERCPLVIDPSGVWFRPEGGGFLAGAPPRARPGEPLDPDEAPLEAIDYGLFDAVIWPALARRVVGFEALRVRSAWAGYYEMSGFDHNAFVGPWPGVEGLWVAAGFSGHGMQQAPAVGEAVALMIVGESVPWLAPLSPMRFFEGRPLVEGNVI